MQSSSFSVTDPQTPKRCIEALNDAFDSIKTLVENYTPETTNQDYAILFYKGKVEEGSTIYVENPVESAIPVYAQYLNTYIYVGDLVERELTFVTTLEDEVFIYQPYRKSIVRETTGLTSERFYDNPEEDIHQ